MLLHPIQSLKQTRFGFGLVLSIQVGLGACWSVVNLMYVWLLTGKRTWMFDFDCPLPQRTFVLFWWLLWTMPPFAGHILADWGFISRQTAKRIVWAFIGLTVVGTVYMQITQ